MKTNGILSKTLGTMFYDVLFKGALHGTYNALKSFFGEHQEELNELVQKSKETEE